MAESVLLGLDGNEDIYECAYVESSVTKLPFFASKVSFFKHRKLLKVTAACTAAFAIAACASVVLCLTSFAECNTR